MNNYRKLAVMSLFAASMGISGISQTVGSLGNQSPRRQFNPQKPSDNHRQKSKR